MSELEVQGDAIIVSTFVVAAIGEVPDLPGVACRHYRRQLLCRVPAALGKGTIALGKGFAECRTQQRPLSKF